MIKNIHIFGATTITGETLSELLEDRFPEYDIFCYSGQNGEINKLNLKESSYKIKNPHNEHLIINIAPIWLFSKFIKSILIKNNKVYQNLKGIISCSSTSVITKRFSSNQDDKRLVEKLLSAETILENICKEKNIPYAIVRPTLIYGKSKNYIDNNINLILKIMNILPIIFLPKNSGLRQPIHSKQLAEVLIKLMLDITKSDTSYSSIINVGGDQELTYNEMIFNLKLKLPKNHNAKKTLLIKIPNPIFFFLTSPLLLIRPQIFEAILRISSNLSGFRKANEFCKNKFKDFPVKPY